MKETLLYRPIKSYLEANGYEVHAEVKGCDIAAVKNGELIVVEQKTAFNATLLIQAVERQKFADSVYLAIPAPRSTKGQWRGMCHLLKRLELGLILVYHPEKNPRVEIQFHPAPFQKRRSPKKRRAVIEEAALRSGDYNVGGSHQIPIVTAYREAALFIAACLQAYGPLSTRRLRELGCGSKTTAILNSNYYGWYLRVERGVYELTPQGRQGLERYAHVVGGFTLPC